jgi:GTP-binding protein Era
MLKFFKKFFKKIFGEKSKLKLGLYGPPNGGKTTLANHITKDWLGEEMGSASAMPHETRTVNVKEKIIIKRKGKELAFNLVDVVVVVLDSSIDPYSQVNITIIGNLEARKIPVLVVANKVDLKKADIKKVQSAFPQYEVIGISAKNGDNMEEFYESIFELVKKK